MAAQTVPVSVNADNIMTPWYVSVSKGTAATAAGTAPMPAVAAATVWTDRALPALMNWNGVAFGNDCFIAICSSTGVTGESNIAASSLNGITWGLRRLPTDASWGAIAYGNGKFVVVADGSTTTLTTDYGTNWVKGSLERSGKYNTIAYGGGKFITIGWNSSTAQVSTDGSTWFNSELPAVRNWSCLTYDSCLNRWVAVASNTNMGAYSNDGSTWAEMTMIKDTSWNSVASNNRGMFVAVTNSLDVSAAYSYDGINWFSTKSLGNAFRWKSVAYGENYDPQYGANWVAVSHSTRNSYSADGINWTQTAATTAKEMSQVISAYIPWRSNDTLTINNAATVTINTNQDKFWSGITINNGLLNIVNSSTNAIRFTTGRVTGALVQAITPTTGQGNINVQGAFIDLSVGTGLPNQEITTPYNDYISCVWVETGQDTSIFEMWLNVTGGYGGTSPKFIEGLNAVSTGQRGKFFVQKPSPRQDRVILLNNASTNIAGNVISLSDTANIYPGASICSKITNYIPATSVVEKIIDGSTLMINQACTVFNNANWDVSVYNPYTSQLSNTLVFGDGTNGNVIPNGSRVLIPNIMLTSISPASVQTSSATVGLSFVMTNGGNINLNTCLLDEAYNNFTQAQSINIKNVGLWNSDLYTECYDVNIENFGIGLPPIRRFYGNTGWSMRDTRDALNTLFLTGTYLNNMRVNNLAAVRNVLGFSVGVLTGMLGMINLGYSNNLNFNNIRLYKLQNYLSGHVGITTNGPISDSTFTNIETYGMMPIFLLYSYNNSIENIIYSSDMFNTSLGYVAGQRLGYDPQTDEELVDNTPYYFKVRNFYTRDRSAYKDSIQVSSTPFLSNKLFPHFFGACPSSAMAAQMWWARREPTGSNPAYEIYRGDSPDFVKDNSSMVFSTNTTTTLAWANAIFKPVITASAARPLGFDASSPGHLYSTGSVQSFLDGSISVGDKIIVTGSVYNNGYYTITNIDSSLKMTLNKGTIIEAPVTAGLTFTVVHPIGKQEITASPTRTLTFNSAKTITAGGSSIGNFINDGYMVGDVIITSGCTNPINNGKKTITTITPTVITVLENLATESTYSSGAKITGKPLQDGSTYYYVLRKYDPSRGTLGGPYYDSPPQEVTISDPTEIFVNRIIQNDTFDNATWVKVNTAVTTNQAVSPIVAPNVGTANADLLVASVSDGYIYQSFLTATDVSYNFSCYVATMPYEQQETSVGGVIMLKGINNASTNFLVDTSWNRVNVTFKADTSALNAYIFINKQYGRLLLSGAMANEGETPNPPITTTTAPVTNTFSSRPPIFVANWCRSYGGETRNSGIEMSYNATVPTGTVWTEVHCSSTKNFEPNIKTCVYNITNAAYNPTVLGGYNYSFGNSIKNVTQLNKAFNCIYHTIWNIGCANNRITDVKSYCNYSALTNPMHFGSFSNDNFIHNWDLGGVRNYSSINIIFGTAAANTAEGLTVQNVRISNSDNPISSTILDTIIKGCTGGNATPAVSAFSYQLGGGVDGMATSYIAVYDSIFNELYFDSCIGALHINFNASLKDPLPYTLIGSTSQFSNTGKLFLQNVSDGIEYTWPHTIYGVSGFRCVPKTILQDGSITTKLLPYKINGLDLGTTNDLLEGVIVEYNIDKGDGSGYTGYKRCNSTNMLLESVSSSEGFNLKIRLVAHRNMKYGTRTTAFVPGETIQGITSRATALVNEVFDVSEGSQIGTLLISDVSGSFLVAENLRSVDASQVRAANLAVNVAFPYGPTFTSYVDGLQLYTYVDTSVLYPSDVITLSITVKDEDNNPISGAYAFIDDAAVSAPYIMNTVTNALGIASVSYSGGPSAGATWRVRKYGYKAYSQIIDIGSEDINIPVTLISDPQQY